MDMEALTSALGQLENSKRLQGFNTRRVEKGDFSLLPRSCETVFA
jgi:hypothetical protein